MAENAPPNEDDTRGVPYYEKLKRDVREIMNKKRGIDKNMVMLEEQIYRFEGSYLEETGAGNIIKGFDNYIKGSGGATGGGAAGGGGGGGSTSTRRKGGNMDQDRVFSRSSVSYMRESSPSSAVSTPGQAGTPASGNATSGAPSRRDSDHPTPTASGASNKGGNKRATKKGAAADKDDDDNDGKPAKRLKITYGRGGERD